MVHDATECNNGNSTRAPGSPHLLWTMYGMRTNEKKNGLKENTSRGKIISRRKKKQIRWRNQMRMHDQKALWHIHTLGIKMRDKITKEIVDCSNWSFCMCVSFSWAQISQNLRQFFFGDTCSRRRKKDDEIFFSVVDWVENLLGNACTNLGERLKKKDRWSEEKNDWTNQSQQGHTSRSGMSEKIIRSPNDQLRDMWSIRAFC